MKRFIFFARVFTGLTFVIPFAAEAQNNESNPYYVVIGAFAKQRNAINFRGEAKTNNYAARFELNPGRNLFYVYVLNTADRELAIEEALKLREKSKYFDTWVYNGYLGKFEATRNQNSGVDINPVTGQSFKSTGPEQNGSVDRNSDSFNLPSGARNTNQGLSTTTGKKGSSTTPEQDAKLNQQRSAGTSNPDGVKSNNNSLSLSGQGDTKTNSEKSSAKTSPLATTKKSSTTTSEQDAKLNQQRSAGTTNPDGVTSNNNSLSKAGQDDAKTNSATSSEKTSPLATTKKSSSTTPEQAAKLNQQKAGTTNPDLVKSSNNPLSTAGQNDTKTDSATSSKKSSTLATTKKNSDPAKENIVSIDQVTKKDEGNLSVSTQQEASKKQNAGLSKTGPGVKNPSATDAQKSPNGNIVSPDGSTTKNVEIPNAANTTSSVKTNKDLTTGGKLDLKTEQKGASIKSADKTKNNLSPGASALKSQSALQQNADSLRKVNSPIKPDMDSLAGVAAAKLEEKSTPPEPLSSEDVIGKNFYFKLFRATNKAVVEGEVDVIDSEKSRRMSTFKGNTPVKVLMPAGKSKVILFVSDVFGYRKLQKEFNPDNPSEDLYLDENGNLVVPFELVRLQKGDIAIMYNVFFFKDAAVMRPESRYEVNNLLELLNENPSYKIVIHGHTNGNANGKILSMGSPEGFYTLTGAKEGFGSAKKLSEERALVMKQYLLSNRIADDRIQIKAWGGKKPIHDKHAVRAQENVRVEIEILSE